MREPICENCGKRGVATTPVMPETVWCHACRLLASMPSEEEDKARLAAIIDAWKEPPKEEHDEPTA